MRPAADSDKLLVFFEGGGACWDGTTCDPAYSESVAGANHLWRDQTFDTDIEKDFQTGIFNMERSPVADYNVVVVSYCTGDLGWGDAIAQYTTSSGEPLTVYHNGVTNTRAVLDWAYRNFNHPSDVAVVGCSAGSLNAMYHNRKL